MADQLTAARNGCLIIALALGGAWAFVSCKAPTQDAGNLETVSAKPSQFRHPFGLKPVPSSWDGLTPEVNAYFKQTLNDYDSLKIVSTYEVTETKEGWAQRVTYRAKNALGAYIIKDSQFIIVNGVVTNEYDLD